MKNQGRTAGSTRWIFCFAIALAMAGMAWSQQISGSITGTVFDEQRAVIAGAKVTLSETSKALVREMNTGVDGRFVFTPLQPGVYTIAVEAPGFKKFEQTEIKIFASDRIQLPEIVLSIGGVTETVTVEGTVVQLQTQGAERSGVLTNNQVVNLALRTRSFFDLAATVPGVIMDGSGLGNIYANGSRGNQNNLTVDGVTNVDTGSNGGALVTLNIDQISEFKLITNSQPAEMGRSSGAAIQVVTKSGSRDFHGTGYWFHRHEGLNANNWRNNLEGRSRQLFRYNYFGYNVGGPVYIPGKFNSDRNKLFFFWSQEFQRQLSPNSLRSVLVPTAAERTGDFSKTVESNGNAVVIRDPLNNSSPFPGNIIPPGRLNADGVKILKFYPLPNSAGVAPDFNHQTQVSDKFPRTEQLIRGDYNINDKWRVYGRYMWTKSEQDRAYGQWNADYNIPYAPMNFGNPGWSVIANVTTVINPTLTNEFIFGSSKNKLNIDPVDDTFDRSKLGLSYTMPYPDADTLGLVQNWRYNVPNAPFTAFNGTPFRNFNHTWDITDNLSKVISGHTFKTGIYVHRSWKDQTAFTSVNGNIWFDRDSQNPGDTNWAYSNAILGNFQRLQQSHTVLNGQYRNWNIEWYAQDSWKVTSRLTVDYGMRFYWIQPQFDQAKQTASFNPALYGKDNTAVLMQPCRNSAGAIAACNPVNGEVAPRALIGAIVNTGKGFVNGLYANGMGLPDQNYPIGLIDDRGIHFAPRLGIAWNVASKTVIRTGAGVFYDRFQGNPVFDMLPNPPSTKSPTFYYGNLANIGQLQGVFFPANVRGFDKAGHVPTTYNWNFSIQRELPYAILFDVGYVGMKSTHNLSIQNFNQAPFGSAWLPQNQDPNNSSPKFDGTTTKPVNLYLPYQGYGSTNVTNFGAFSNYHGLQVSANRRLSKNFTFGMAYTWSKALGVSTGDGDVQHPLNARMANYGPLGFDRRHNFILNYTFEVPSPTKNKIAGLFVNDWVISGITTFQSGLPDFINFSVAGIGGAELNRRITGSETYGPRIVYKGKVNYKKDVYGWINTDVFAVPQKGSIGLDSSSRPIVRPGINNWDISIFKEIPFGAESRYLQLRLEMFNAWNHTQFSDFNRSATFNAAGQITNLPTALGGTGGRFGFGAVTAARDPRLIQIAAKFYF